jgi:hypothetical protein
VLLQGFGESIFKKLKRLKVSIVESQRIKLVQKNQKAKGGRQQAIVRVWL